MPARGVTGAGVVFVAPETLGWALFVLTAGDLAWVAALGPDVADCGGCAGSVAGAFSALVLFGTEVPFAAGELTAVCEEPPIVCPSQISQFPISR